MGEELAVEVSPVMTHFDRVVFDFRGAATGYNVRYADQVLSEGKGDALPVAGGARIWVELQEPAYDIQTGALTSQGGAAANGVGELLFALDPTSLAGAFDLAGASRAGLRPTPRRR